MTLIPKTCAPLSCRRHEPASRVFSLDIGRGISIFVMTCVHTFGTWIDIPWVLKSGIFAGLLAPVVLFAQFRGIFVVFSTAVIGYRAALSVIRPFSEGKSVRSILGRTWGKSLATVFVSLLCWPLFSLCDVMRDAGEMTRNFVSLTNTLGPLIEPSRAFFILPRSSPIGFISLLYILLNLLIPIAWSIVLPVAARHRRRVSQAYEQVDTDSGSNSGTEPGSELNTEPGTEPGSITGNARSPEDTAIVPEVVMNEPIPAPTPGMAAHATYRSSFGESSAVANPDDLLRQVVHPVSEAPVAVVVDAEAVSSSDLPAGSAEVGIEVEIESAPRSTSRCLVAFLHTPIFYVWLGLTVFCLVAALVVALVRFPLDTALVRAWRSTFFRRGFIDPTSPAGAEASAWVTMADVVIPAQLRVHWRPGPDDAPVPLPGPAPDVFSPGLFVLYLLTQQVSGDLMGVFPFGINALAGLSVGALLGIFALDVDSHTKSGRMPTLTLAARRVLLYAACFSMAAVLLTVWGVWWAIYPDPLEARHSFQGFYFYQRIFDEHANAELNHWHTAPFECMLTGAQLLTISFVIDGIEFSRGSRRWPAAERPPLRKRLPVRWIRRFSTYSVTAFTLDCFLGALSYIVGRRIGLAADPETHYLTGFVGTLYVITMPLWVVGVLMLCDLGRFLPCPDMLLSTYGHILTWALEEIIRRRPGAKKRLKKVVPDLSRFHLSAQRIRFFTTAEALPPRRRRCCCMPPKRNEPSPVVL